ncbi:Diacylglycerol O-acyltransferase [Venturia nashicola]|nr:Diacylglycerol O-acyltransferase [Venturia nashicola]
MARSDGAPRKIISGKAPKLAPAQQGPRPGPRPEPRPPRKAPPKPRVRKREPDSENDEPAPPPKRASKIEKPGAKREPIVISDEDYEPVSSRRTLAREAAKAGVQVRRSPSHIAGDGDDQTIQALEARRREPLKTRLFYSETSSKQRHAKRIFGVRPFGQMNEKGVSEYDASTKDNATMGHIRHRIAKFLGFSDVFNIQLESSTLSAKPSTFKARGTICDRVNAIWNEIEHHDQKTVQEIFQKVKAPWLRVRTTEYIIVFLPDLKLEVCVTPSDVAVVGDLRKIAAALTRNNLPRSFHVSINDVEIFEGEDDLRFLDVPLRHKSVVTCVPEIHECSICAEDVGFLDWPGRLNATTCKHESSTCNPCLRNWITEALDNNNTDKITCPECEVVFEYNDLKKHATEEEFDRYDRLSTRAALSAIPEFRWCIAPFCESGQIHASEDTIMTCTECKFRICTNCDREFHDGETCDEYTERMGIQDDLIKQSEEAIEQLAKQCPGCKSRIEKDGGCDHMTCKLSPSTFPLTIPPFVFKY